MPATPRTTSSPQPGNPSLRAYDGGLLLLRLVLGLTVAMS